jgi:tRNA threonylcarbamoyladenosine biosynthesis protein TsaB
MALARGAQLIEEVLLHSPDGFAHLLFGELRMLLKRHSIRLGDIDCFAAANGPGSFTGIRVALSAVKGLAEATRRSVVAVSNLQAIAWYGTAALRAPVIDARRGEVYGGLYDGSLNSLLPETVSSFEMWRQSLPDGADLEIVCNDASAFPISGLRATASPRATGRAVADLALRRFRKGAVQDPAAIDANYVRRSDAEQHWEGR